MLTFPPPPPASRMRLALGSYSVRTQELTDEGGTIGRYVVAHEDPAAGVYLHPVLLEKLHKSKSYSLAHYVDELHAVCGRTVELAALAKVCAGKMPTRDAHDMLAPTAWSRRAILACSEFIDRARHGVRGRCARAA